MYNRNLPGNPYQYNSYSNVSSNPVPSYSQVTQNPTNYFPIQHENRPGLPSYHQVAPPTSTTKPGIISFSNPSLNRSGPISQPSYGSSTSPNTVTTGYNTTSVPYSNIPNSFNSSQYGSSVTNIPAQLSPQKMAELRAKSIAENQAKFDQMTREATLRLEQKEREQEEKLRQAQIEKERREYEEKMKREQEQVERIRREREEQIKQQQIERARREYEEKMRKEQIERAQKEYEERMKKELEQAEIIRKETEEAEKRRQRELELQQREEQLRQREIQLEMQRQAMERKLQEEEKNKVNREAFEQKYQQREKELLQILEKEREERKLKEINFRKEQEEREALIRKQEQIRVQNAIEKFKAENLILQSDIRAREEERIRKEMQMKFDDEAQKRQQEFKREQEEIQQSDEFFDCNWKIKVHEIEFGEKIAAGAFGEVCKGKLRGKEVAIKRLQNFNLQLSQQQIEENLVQFREEISIMSNLRHPNLLLFIGACLEPIDKICIITEYLSLGNLQDVLKNKNIRLDIKQKLQILKGIAQGMNYLHSLHPPFLHCDLKTQNILLDHHFSPRVSDFGLSSVKQSISGPIGSPYYMAPEILVDKPFTTKSDVYSFSIIIWEAISTQEPYKDKFESFDEVVEGITIDAIRPDLLPWFPLGITALLKKTWHDDPNERLSFDEILKAQWFDHILVDCCISQCSISKTFWKQFFLDQIEVPVDRFTNSLKQFCKFNGNDLHFLKLWEYLVSEASPFGLLTVSINHFSSTVSWFAPFSEPLDLLVKPYSYVSKPWFFGLFQPNYENLISQPPGSFLVSQSKIMDNNLREYKLTFIDLNTKTLRNVPFYQDPRGIFIFNNLSFDDWNPLLFEMQKYCAFNIETPFTGSPFYFLHNSNQK